MATRKPLSAVTLTRTPEITTIPHKTASDEVAASLSAFGSRMHALGDTLLEKDAQRREGDAALEGAKAGQQAGAAGGTFSPGRQGNRFANAYDRAGLESYFDELKITSGDAVERIYNEHRGNPAQLDASLAAYQKGIEENLNKTMPELIGPFRSYMDRSARPYRHEASADHFKSVEDQARASQLNLVTALQRQHEQRAFIGGDTIEAIADITLDRREFTNALVRGGPQEAFELDGVTYEADPTRSGVYGVTDLQKGLLGYDLDITGARYMGQFNREQKAGRGERYAMKFLNSNEARQNLGLDGHDKLLSWMRTKLSERAAFAEATDRSVGQAVAAFRDSIAHGNAPGGGDQLLAMTRGTKYEPEMRMIMGNQDLLTSYRKMNLPQQADAVKQQRDALAAMDPAKMGAEQYAIAARSKSMLIDDMEKSHAALGAALKEDTYATAIATGVVAEPPPLFDESGQVNAKGLAKRFDDARFASNYYPGFTAAPFTSAETQAIGGWLKTQSPQDQASFFSALGAAAPDAPRMIDRMLPALQKNFPDMAQVALFGARQRVSEGRDVATMLAAGSALLNPPDGKPARFKFASGEQGMASFQNAFDRYVGDTFISNAAARSYALEGVKAIYAALAEQTSGGLEGRFDSQTFASAARAYFGAEPIKVHGVRVFAPYGVDESHFKPALAGSIRSTMKASGYADDQIEAVVRNGMPRNVDGGYIVTTEGGFVLDAKGSPMVFKPQVIEQPDAAIEDAPQGFGVGP